MSLTDTKPLPYVPPSAERDEIARLRAERDAAKARAYAAENLLSMTEDVAVDRERLRKLEAFFAAYDRHIRAAMVDTPNLGELREAEARAYRTLAATAPLAPAAPLP